MTPSLLELCDHARTSCRVNGLIPKEWRWEAGLANALHNTSYDKLYELPNGASIELMRHQGLPVYLMADPNQTGVACIGKKPYVALLENKE